LEISRTRDTPRIERNDDQVQLSGAWVNCKCKSIYLHEWRKIKKDPQNYLSHPRMSRERGEMESGRCGGGLGKRLKRFRGIDCLLWSVLWKWACVLSQTLFTRRSTVLTPTDGRVRVCVNCWSSQRVARWHTERDRDYPTEGQNSKKY
jgi:hypothetical protein